MGSIFSDRISDVPRSFIREILKVAVDKSLISFAGGLPNRDLFPVEEIKQAAYQVLDESGKDVLQYSTSEGFAPLRKWISDRYLSAKGLAVDPNEILILSGSQQGLDLMGKILLNEGDNVAIEKPGYLGAIQAFSLYRSRFHQIPLSEEGPDIGELSRVIHKHQVKLLYTVPNFQNPSGATYSQKAREQVTAVLSDTDTILIEDDPYGELRFRGTPNDSFRKLMPENTVLLGTFSKIVVPSFRIGWVVAREDIKEKLLIAKQAADLHTNSLGQRVIYQYLINNDIDKHIELIRAGYGRQREAMVSAIREYLPDSVTFTEPEGGMFLWVTLPPELSSMKLFDIAIEKKVAFVPGTPFYPDNPEHNTLRLNFSSVDEETIREGIRRLNSAIEEYTET
ncbi:MAG: PLP-dependent aminotransferase family protein [Spirochaetales bacterium]|nr:PLP-dependent aminotransferase family protein [Spirochaetales bacterium]